MPPKFNTTDPDIRGSLPALKRAARRALALGKATGAPVYAMKRGRVVNFNPIHAKRRKKAS
jgi:hypothetical protein